VFTRRTGLWKRPVPVASTKSESGLWKSKSLPRISLNDTLLPVLPFSASGLFGDIPFIHNTDSSPSVVISSEVSPFHRVF
jgi:hypothetical protein